MECDLMIYLYVLNVALMVVKSHVMGCDYCISILILHTKNI